MKIDIVHPGYLRAAAAALEAAAGEVILCSPMGALPDMVTDGVTGSFIGGNPSDPAVTGSSWSGSDCSPKTLPAGKGWRKRPASSPPPMTSPGSSSRYGNMPSPGSWRRPRPGRRGTDPARYATRPGRRAIGLTRSPSGHQQ